jgi:ectoine hydroxylase-related dioxygenase (phytanoyl-CoA dioxygenase family)
VADSYRPFFAWHTHIGGIDDGKYRREGVWPHFDEPQRLMTLLYVNDIEPDNGPLLVYPRRVADPTPPPFDPYLKHWPDEVVLTPRKGSVVMMDQCTWHAVRAKQSAGIRSFIGCYFRSSKAPPTEWEDESLRAIQGGSELLRSVLPGRSKA